MPPRHGKSELVSRYFPAWYLGTHPDKRIILASYEADFAATWRERYASRLGPLRVGRNVRIVDEPIEFGKGELKYAEND